ncbi:MAG: hypothetical protein AAF483_22660 [Planctomycetota bacterium]
MTSEHDEMEDCDIAPADQFDAHETADEAVATTDKRPNNSPSIFPKWIGPYRIIKRSGEGGTGVVYLA